MIHSRLYCPIFVGQMMATHLQNTGIVVVFSDFINRVFIGLIITSVKWPNPVIPFANAVRNDGRKL